MFPNPSAGKVNFVSGHERAVLLSIYDTGGRLVLEREFVGRLSIELVQGIYVYRMDSRTSILIVR